MSRTISTAEARKHLGDTLEALTIARSSDDANRERTFLYWTAQYVEALKRSHNTYDLLTAVKIETLVLSRDYTGAFDMWNRRQEGLK